MTENEKKYIVDLAAVCGEKRGFDAAKLVRAHVLSLGLLGNDTTTKVWYEFGGLCEWWNKPDSMTYDDGARTVNGGYRTRLSNAFSKRTPAEVAAAQGNGTERAPADPNAPVVHRAKKGAAVQLDLESGSVNFMVENAVIAWSFSTKQFTMDLVAMSTYSNMVGRFAGNPREFITAAVEMDESGNPVTNSWVMGRYTSALTTEADAKKDIMKQAVSAAVDGDFSELTTLAVSVPVRQGASVKLAFVNKWVPEIILVKAAPTPPSETPSTLDPKLVDTGMGS